jgi:hypothetical protein
MVFKEGQALTATLTLPYGDFDSAPVLALCGVW